MNSLSLIIPTYNRCPYLEQTLRSLDELDVPPGIDVEVLVIDNNCRDLTAEVVTQAMSEHKLPIRHIVETQQGLSFGRNRGIAEARYDHLGFLDDDILVSPQWVVSYFQAVRDFQADAVVGPVFPIFERSQPDFIRGRALEIISSGYSRKGETPLLLPDTTAHELPGCNFGVSRELARRLNGFNTQLDRIGKNLLAGGDTEFGLRLVASGGRTAYHPGCSIKHVMAEEKLSKNYLRKRALGLGATVNKMRHRQPALRELIRPTLGTARLWAGVLWTYLTLHPEAFNQELHARQAWGNLWG